MPHLQASRGALRALLVAGLLCAPAGGRASISPEARAVVERYLEVIGGKDALLNERTTRIKGTLSAFGLAGAVEGWTARPDKSASVTTIGPFTLRDGYDGTVAWRVDQNGKLAVRDGKDLEDARASAYFENELWLMPDQGGGAVSRVASERDSAGGYAVLEVTPPVGRSRRVWFSERTGLVDRVVARQDVRTVTSRLSDYRLAAGRLRPHATVVEVEGMPGNTARITLDSVWVNLPVDPAVFRPAEAAAGDVRFLRGSGPVRLPFRYGTRHIWLEVSLNGLPPADFLLDTGASITVIDSGYAAANGLRTEGRLQATGAGATGGAALAEVDSLRVAGPDGDGVLLHGQKVAVLSVNPYVEPFFWQPVAGVLGYDFASRFVMEVDYDRGLLTLHDPGRFQYQGPGAAVPLTLAGNIPVVKATIDGRYEGGFRVDLGSSSTVDLHSPFVRRHGLLASAGKTFEVMGGGFGGTFTSTVSRMSRMEIGPFSWSDPVVVLSHAAEGGLASEDYAGNLGNQVLERFRCTLDYERRVLYLEPGKRYAARDRFSMAGFQLVRREGKVLAMQVLPGTPAAEAGLRAGDQVLALDGRPIGAYGPDRIRAIFQEGEAGRRHRLEIARDGKKRKVRIRLREIL